MLKRFLILASILILPSCAETELASHAVKKVQNQAPIPVTNKSKGRFKVGSSYRIKGIRYTPRETYNFTQTGIASWYGPNFHGKLTANGEVFDKYDLTVAHKTLQMPAILRVTNLENGRSIIARVNDRGPFSKGRILDVSERGAELLDFKHKGTARVKIEILQQESLDVARIAKAGGSTIGYEVALNKIGYKPKAVPSNTTSAPRAQSQSVAPAIQRPPTPQSKPENIYVQAGSFNNVVKARALAERLSNIGTARIQTINVNNIKYYRVQFGPMDSQPQAEALQNKLASANISEPILIRE